MAVFLALSFPFKTFVADFKQKTEEAKTTSIVSGKIYFKKPKVFILWVNSPVNQIIKLEKDGLLIYYPDTKQALKVKSDKPLNFPLINTFFGINQEDLGLSEMGWNLERRVNKNGKLVTYWKPPKKFKKVFKEFVLEFKDGKPSLAESRDRKGKPVVRSIFKNYIEFKGFYFPKTIVTEWYFKGKLISRETVQCSNTKFNAKIPAKVLHFKLPRNIKIKEIEW